MLELLVPSSTAARLRQVRAHAELPAPLRNDLIQALRPPKLSGASAADVTQSSDDAPVRVPRRVLVDVAAWVREYAPDDALTLDALLRGAQIYFEPRPVYRRVRRCGFCLPQPPELEASLAAIRRAHEEAEFAQMSTPRDNKERECSAPYTFTSAAPRDPAVVAAEHQTWQETRSQLSAVINVIVSMLAVATAVWWGSGSAGVLWKVSVGLALALLVGTAETVMYAKQARFVKAQREMAKRARVKSPAAGQPGPALLRRAPPA